MDYHNFQSLYTIISNQYKKDKNKETSNNKNMTKNQNQAYSKLLDYYNKPSIKTATSAIIASSKINTVDTLNKYATYDNPDNYLYLSNKNYL